MPAETVYDSIREEIQFLKEAVDDIEQCYKKGSDMDWTSIECDYAPLALEIYSFLKRSGIKVCFLKINPHVSSQYESEMEKLSYWSFPESISALSNFIEIEELKLKH